MKEVSRNLMKHIEEELRKLEYGSVTIKVVNSKTADVITEDRKRFLADDESDHKEGSTYRQG